MLLVLKDLPSLTIFDTVPRKYFEKQRDGT